MSLAISFIISTAVISTFAAYTEQNGKADDGLDLLSASKALEKVFG
jgi:hypothetical protein